MNLCQICGNDLYRGCRVCGFCGSEQPEMDAESCPRPFVHRTVNLEKGMPFVEQAISQLHSALNEARLLQVQVLTIIHGYGSSGRGGAIRKECRKILDYMCSSGEISNYIAGEDFHRRSGSVKDVLNRYPQLNGNGNLNRNNRGVTLIIL